MTVTRAPALAIGPAPMSLVAVLALAGCRSGAIPLEDTRGRQWVWPYFAHRQPTVLAFWDCDHIESIEAMPALNTLNKRDSDVQLLTVCVEPDRMRADNWLRKQRANFVVILDPEERLARRLRVRSYPTFVYFDTGGDEVARYHDIRSAWKFFDLPRFVEKGRP
jgi:hypothetical protein